LIKTWCLVNCVLYFSDADRGRHMNDPSRDPDTGDDLGVGIDRESTSGTPRWVKAFGLIAAVLLVLLLVIALLTGGHGPGRHALSGHVGGDTPHSAIAKRGVAQR
jgi:hypothetical protein